MVRGVLIGDKPTSTTGLSAGTAGAGLKSRFLRAGSWSLLAHFAGQVLRFGSSLVMTRLLVPEMFGVMAIATVVLVIVSLLSDVGLRQAIIQSPRGDTPEMLNTAWVIMIVRGFLVWSVCLAVALALHLGAAAGWLAAGSVYAAPDLPAVMAVSSFAAVITGFQSTKVAINNRRLDLGRVTVIEIGAQVLGIVVMIALGWATRSIWSFVVGSLVSALVSVGLSHAWVHGTPNRLRWDPSAARELLGFGRWILASSVLYVLASNADRLLLGGWVGAATLGVYTLAFNICSVVEGAGSRLFAATVMPALSEVVRSQPHRVREVYWRMRLPLDLVFLGCAGLLYALGPALVALLYDPRYAEAGTMLQILSFMLVMARYGINGSAYMALGHPRMLMWVHVGKLACAFALIPLGHALYGLHGALWAIALQGLPLLPLMLWFDRRLGLADLRFEALVLGAWPVGYGAGLLVVYGFGG